MTVAINQGTICMNFRSGLMAMISHLVRCETMVMEVTSKLQGETIPRMV